ncbi:hypothetical protein JQN06_16870 [Bacteroides uniformis]|uniref:Uncharacterized protein n=1 Tax=Bacteroides uniformis TaxID=820 RepID=A0ABS5X768_BACUN|nr:hypothetical protein [Bacteroides uniformis]
MLWTRSETDNRLGIFLYHIGYNVMYAYECIIIYIKKCHELCHILQQAYRMIEV